MKRPSVRFYGMALALALAVGAGASDAQAQEGGLPTIYTRGDISYTSGGVGQDEEQAFRSATPNWPLALQFSGQGGDYIADVHIDILRKDGTKVLVATSQGPFMLVKLPPGDYVIRAAYKHKAQEKAVHVSGHASASFRWQN